MTKRFSKMYGNKDELSTTCYPKDMSRCLSVPDLEKMWACYESYGKNLEMELQLQLIETMYNLILTILHQLLH